MLDFLRFFSWHVEFLRVDLGLSSIRSRVVCRHFCFFLWMVASRGRDGHEIGVLVSPSSYTDLPSSLQDFSVSLLTWMLLPIFERILSFLLLNSQSLQKTNAEFRSPWWRSNLVSFQACLHLFCVRPFCRIDSVSWSLLLFCGFCLNLLQVFRPVYIGGLKF